MSHIAPHQVPESWNRIYISVALSALWTTTRPYQYHQLSISSAIPQSRQNEATFIPLSSHKMQFTSVLLALAPAAVLAATEAFPGGCSAMVLTYYHMLQASCENSAGVHSTSSLDLAEHIGASDGELVVSSKTHLTEDHITDRSIVDARVSLVFGVALL